MVAVQLFGLFLRALLIRAWPDNSESVIRLYTSRELLTAREPVGDWSTVYFGGSGISVWVRVH